MTGHYRMARGWLDNPALSGGPFDKRSAWAWLIEQAQYQPGKVNVAGRTVPLERGQLCHSYRHLAAAWGWSLGAVQRFLNRLQTDTMIDTAKVCGRLIITVCNYSLYQAPCRPADPPADTPADTAAIRQRYNTKVSKKPIRVEDTSRVDGGCRGEGPAGGPAPDPAPGFGQDGQGDIDRLARWAEANGYDRREGTLPAAEPQPAPAPAPQPAPVPSYDTPDPAAGDRRPEDAQPAGGVPAANGNALPEAGGRRADQGTRWPKGRPVPDEWIALAYADRKRHGLPEINLEAVACDFADYWTGVAGAKGRKLDWEATWRKWARTQNGGSYGRNRQAGFAGNHRISADRSRHAIAAGVMDGLRKRGLAAG